MQQPAAASASAVDQQPRRVTFWSPGGHELVGMHMLPGSAHAVVLQHGYTSSKDGFHLARIAEGLARGGVGSLRLGAPYSLHLQPKIMQLFILQKFSCAGFTAWPCMVLAQWRCPAPEEHGCLRRWQDAPGAPQPLLSRRAP